MAPLEAVVSGRILLAAVMLGYAAWRDVKTREVNDLVWIVFGGAGLLLDALELYVGSLSLLEFGFSLAVALAFGLFSGRLGFFGGADLLAFVAVALLHPAPPLLPFQPLGFRSIVFVFSVISNAVLFGASMSLVMLAVNLAEWRGRVFSGLSEPSWRKALLVLTGRRMALRDVKGPPLHYPLEAFEDEVSSKRSVRLRPTLSDDSSAVEVFNRLRRLGVESTWVSVTLPFVAALALGYAATLLYGDVMLSIISRVVH